MCNFEELDKRKSSEVEGSLTEKFFNENLLSKTIENRKDNENFVFFAENDLIKPIILLYMQIQATADKMIVNK